MNILKCSRSFLTREYGIDSNEDSLWTTYIFSNSLVNSLIIYVYTDGMKFNTKITYFYYVAIVSHSDCIKISIYT